MASIHVYPSCSVFTYESGRSPDSSWVFLLAMGRARLYVDDMTAVALISAEDLPRRQPPDKRAELVSGRMVVREPAGHLHGRIANKLAYLLTRYVEERDLGVVYAAETGFLLARDPDTVRAPDVAFMVSDRLPEPEPIGYAELAPDLVVEVLSPNDRPGEVLARVGDWLSAGTRLLWVVDPAIRHIRVYRQDGSLDVVGEGEPLAGEDVVPGLSFTTDAIF